jgi:beta-galactosidase/beta-glucuronidase
MLGTSEPYHEGWWNWGGLIRDVEAWPVQQTVIEHVWNRTSIKSNTASTELMANITNSTSQPSNITASGTMDTKQLTPQTVQLMPGETKTVSWKLSFPTTKLWSTHNPQLLDVHVSTQGTAKVDQWNGQVGLRTIQIKSGKLYLNNQLLRVFGVNFHEATATGWASTPEQQDQLLQLAQQTGANIIRSHYPLSPRIIDAADRMGLLVWDEIPVWQPQPSTLAEPLERSRARQAFQEMMTKYFNV